jgi:hypothetical protein
MRNRRQWETEGRDHALENPGAFGTKPLYVKAIGRSMWLSGAVLAGWQVLRQFANDGRLKQSAFLCFWGP